MTNLEAIQVLRHLFKFADVLTIHMKEHHGTLKIQKNPDNTYTYLEHPIQDNILCKDIAEAASILANYEQDMAKFEEELFEHSNYRDVNPDLIPEDFVM